MWRALRIAILLFILATVALGAWREQTRSQAWERTLNVTIYPINADRSAGTDAYLEQLSLKQFKVLEQWFDTEAKRHGINIDAPVQVRLAAPVKSLPPPAPSGGSALDNMLWSLQLRYWAWRHSDGGAVKPSVRLYALYHDPDRVDTLAHSIGLRKGLIGVAHLFASRHAHGSNTVVLTHELMHTLGATDKYDPATLLPNFPDGYADPYRAAPLPQQDAEIMGGRIPVSETEALIPRHLSHVVVGPRTAGEIGWPVADATPAPP